MRRLAPLLAAALATALLWLAFGTQESLPQLARGEQDWSGDFRDFYLPNAEFAAERLRDGALPLWNPRHAAGGPLLATLQVAVFYPPNLLRLLLPEPTAFALLAALHVALSVLTAGLLARVLGADAWGSVLAGVAYATSLQVVGGIFAPPVLHAAAWAPAVFLGVDRIAARATWARAAGLALVLGAMLLSGWPYAFAITGLGAGVYGAVLLLARTARERRLPLASSAALLGAVAVGLLLAAPQLLPTQELLGLSARAIGSIVEGQAIFVRPPHDPAAFLGSLRRSGFNDGVPGVVAVFLAPLALLWSGSRARCALLLAIGAFGLLASFANNTPVYGWLRELPVLGDFRFPFRYRLLPTVALATLAGVGLTRLRGAVAAGPGLAAATGVLALVACLLTGAAPVWGRVTPFAWNRPEPRSVRADLERVGVTLPEDGFERVYWAGRSHKAGAGEPPVVHDMEPITLARTAQMLTYFETGRPLTLLTLRRHPVRDRGKESPAQPFSGFLVMPDEGSRARVLDYFGARWIASRSPAPWLARRYRRLTAEGSDVAVFENDGALPRAYRAARAIPEPAQRRAALKALLAEEFDPRRFALIGDPPPELLGRRRRPVRPDTGSVEIVAHEPERVVLRTRGGAPAIVVLADAWFPGWEATVDGEAARVLRANVGFRGVAVAAGEHEIEMRYRPASLRSGLALGGLGLVFVAAAFSVTRWRSGNA